MAVEFNFLSRHPKLQLAVSIFSSLFLFGLSIFLILSVAGIPVAGVTLSLGGAAAWNAILLLGFSASFLSFSAYLFPWWGSVHAGFKSCVALCKQGITSIQIKLSKGVLRGMSRSRMAAPKQEVAEKFTQRATEAMSRVSESVPNSDNPNTFVQGVGPPQPGNDLKTQLFYQKDFSYQIETEVLPLLQGPNAQGLLQAANKLSQLSQDKAIVKNAPVFIEIASQLVAKFTPAQLLHYINYFLAERNHTSGQIEDWLEVSDQVSSLLYYKHHKALPLLKKLIERVSEDPKALPRIHSFLELLPALKAINGVLHAKTTDEGLKQITPKANATYYLFELSQYFTIIPAWLQLLNDTGFSTIDFTQAYKGYEHDNTEFVAFIKNFIAALPQYPNITAVHFPPEFARNNSRLVAQVNTITARHIARFAYQAQYDQIAKDYLEQIAPLIYAWDNPSSEQAKNFFTYERGHLEYMTQLIIQLLELEKAIRGRYREAVATLEADILAKDPEFVLKKNKNVIKQIKGFNSCIQRKKDYQEYLEDNNLSSAMQDDYQNNKFRALIILPEEPYQEQDFFPPDYNSLWRRFKRYWLRTDDPPLRPERYESSSLLKRKDNIATIIRNYQRALGLKTKTVAYEDMYKRYKECMNCLHPDKNKNAMDTMVAILHPNDTNAQAELREKLNALNRDRMMILQEIWNNYKLVTSGNVDNQTLFDLCFKSYHDEVVYINICKEFRVYAAQAEEIQAKARAQAQGQTANQNHANSGNENKTTALQPQPSVQDRESALGYIRRTCLSALRFETLVVSEKELYAAYQRYMKVFQSAEMITQMVLAQYPADLPAQQLLQAQLNTLFAAAIPLLKSIWVSYEAIATREKADLLTDEDILALKTKIAKDKASYDELIKPYGYMLNNIPSQAKAKTAEQVAQATDTPHTPVSTANTTVPLIPTHDPDPHRQSPSHSETASETAADAMSSSAVGAGKMALSTWVFDIDKVLKTTTPSHTAVATLSQYI